MNGSPSVSKPSRTSTLPVSPETLLFALYPVILILGSLWSTITVDTTLSPYNADLQSHEPATAPSYFARKDNLLNIYFVKRGWAWLTLAFLLQASRHASDTKRLAQAGLRYAAATATWILVTQWAFGPALIDRTFSLSGGLCEISAQAAVDEAAANAGVVSGAGCRAAGGRWTGGHDISGHVFLLILGSGMLLLEMMPLLREKDARRTNSLGVRAALAVSALSGWMLLMTAAYFHTWAEKFTGLAVALSALWTIYVLPRRVEALRGVIGTPAS
ncbi:hypothetical protein ANO11243_082640 [Dothideomycetidae sp. 11243]|nr:hypothetical protein ANO11243_082640 [fungal sp. No.11243]